MIFMLFLVVIIGISLVMTLLVMWIMNLVFSPECLEFVFGVSSMQFWHTYGLLVLCNLLTSGNHINLNRKE